MVPLLGESVGGRDRLYEAFMRRLAVLAALALLATVVGFGPGSRGVALGAGGSTLNRPEDPVVLTGADVPSLAGIAPGDVVAFRYDTAWVQIPVQVDERDVKTFGAVYNNSLPPVYNAHMAVSALQYTDANTWTGADSNPTLDSNDEIAFMANDAGGPPPSFSQPTGIVSNSGVQVKITDPLAGGQTGYVYLFRQDGSLTPGAGQSYVSYTFSLNSGAYKTTYTLGDTHTALAGNPENSTIVTPNYTYHFGDRWQEDGITISVGGATNVDILDRHKAMYAPGFCGRSEDTFDGYVNTLPIEGAFVVNKSGPVRAIRSYVGANSGPITEREHIFYARRQDTRTFLRVHSIPSVMDVFDYSSAASGMTYYNDLNVAGVTIDGTPDTVVAGQFQWQMVTGAQGTLVQAASVSTNIPGFAYTSYYYDQAPAITTQCNNDPNSYGSSGAWVNPGGSGIPCTDPGTNCTNYMNTTSVLYYEAPGASVASAQALNNDAKTALTYTLQAWQNLTPGVGGIAEAATPLAPSGGAGTRNPFVLALVASAGAGGLLLMARRR